MLNTFRKIIVARTVGYWIKETPVAGDYYVAMAQRYALSEAFDPMRMFTLLDNPDVIETIVQSIYGDRDRVFRPGSYFYSINRSITRSLERFAVGPERAVLSSLVIAVLARMKYITAPPLVQSVARPAFIPPMDIIRRHLPLKMLAVSLPEPEARMLVGQMAKGDFVLYLNQVFAMVKMTYTEVSNLMASFGIIRTMVNDLIRRGPFISNSMAGQPNAAFLFEPLTPLAEYANFLIDMDQTTSDLQEPIYARMTVKAEVASILAALADHPTLATLNLSSIPGLYRRHQIEKIELRRHCITFLRRNIPSQKSPVLGLMETSINLEAEGVRHTMLTTVPRLSEAASRLMAVFDPFTVELVDEISSNLAVGEHSMVIHTTVDERELRALAISLSRQVDVNDTEIVYLFTARRRPVDADIPPISFVSDTLASTSDIVGVIIYAVGEFAKSPFPTGDELFPVMSRLPALTLDGPPPFNGERVPLNTPVDVELSELRAGGRSDTAHLTIAGLVGYTATSAGVIILPGAKMRSLADIARMTNFVRRVTTVGDDLRNVSVITLQTRDAITTLQASLTADQRADLQAFVRQRLTKMIIDLVKLPIIDHIYSLAVTAVGLGIGYPSDVIEAGYAVVNRLACLMALLRALSAPEQVIRTIQEGISDRSQMAYIASDWFSTRTIVKSTI